MKEIIDNFSDQSGNYASFRPVYPDDFYNYLFSIVQSFDAAWDCGTGNGQVAVRLAEKFKIIYATDISQSQLDKAIKQEHIIYSKQRAEQTNLPANCIDLVTVAQAIHWFDFEAFYNEVKRVAKPGAYIMVSTYNLLHINSEIDNVINTLYLNILKGYWDKERKYVDEAYKTIPFPFKEIEAPHFNIHVKWSFEQLIGYLNTWSATKHYIKKNRTNPLDQITGDLKKYWLPGETREIIFPLSIRLGQIVK